ncbi:MAG: PD-(D/E)XK nuclease family protein [Clostridia bacterium]|nr:PD-(D/E)XK nuclease family protein [Clostridia bacterium]
MLSASRLEKYNACAFSYFMSYGLLASEREKAGIEPRSTGSIQHAALFKYFSRLKEKNADYAKITKEECFADVYDIVKREATENTELLYESSSYYKYVVTRMQGIAARTAWEVVKFYRSSLFRPMGFEIEIKAGGEIPMIAIKDNDGKKIAAVRGVVDRADIAQIDGKKYISVVDYKSSKKTLDERLAEAGVNIQPLLYSDIVCERMNASPAAMLYMQMTDPIVDEAKLRGINEAEIERATNGEITLGGWLNDDVGVVAGYSRGGENGEKYTPRGRASLIGEAELKRRIAVANKKIQESAIGIYEGNIKAEPYIDKNYDACRYCIFGGLCNKGDN